MKSSKKTKSSKSSFLDLLFEYAFAELGFFLGLYAGLFVLSMVGLKGKIPVLWFGISLIVGIAAALFLLVRSEIGRTEVSTAFHKELDEGREKEAFRLSTMLRFMSPLKDGGAALVASIVMLILRGMIESSFVLALITLLPVTLLLIVLRLPAMLLARKQWAKEHIRK